MKQKWISIAVALLAILSLSYAEPKKLDAKTLDELKKSHKVLNTPEVTLKEGLDLGSVYHLKVQHATPQGNALSYAFYDKSSKSIYVGRGYTKEGNMLNFPKDAKVIKEGVSYSYGSGKKEIYLITDPECSYCKKFEKATQGKLGDYTVHVILFPLSFHKNAPAMSEWIMQGKDGAEKQKRLQDITLNNSKEYQKLVSKEFKYSPAVKEKMDKAQAAFAELEARGTPAVFNEKFEPINWGKLAK
ncbi:MAG: thioredoxin fold domain-containing protein [Campylobacterota bacterium]|nr:thioredoxin fold domain-containing protein [Campylobacterota bacterium]